MGSFTWFPLPLSYYIAMIKSLRVLLRVTMLIFWLDVHCTTLLSLHFHSQSKYKYHPHTLASSALSRLRLYSYASNHTMNLNYCANGPVTIITSLSNCLSTHGFYENILIGVIILTIHVHSRRKNNIYLRIRKSRTINTSFCNLVTQSNITIIVHTVV